VAAEAAGARVVVRSAPERHARWLGEALSPSRAAVTRARVPLPGRGFAHSALRQQQSKVVVAGWLVSLSLSLFLTRLAVSVYRPAAGAARLSLSCSFCRVPCPAADNTTTHKCVTARGVFFRPPRVPARRPDMYAYAAGPPHYAAPPTYLPPQMPPVPVPAPPVPQPAGL
jgi:hypothetical protein